jgi:hypothetical protein
MEQIEKYKLLVACYEQELERICQENNTEPSHDFQREVEQIKKEINEL